MRKPTIEPKENCISDFNCVAVCGEVFRQGADGKAEVIEMPDYEQYADSIDKAIRECPAQIIKWKE